MLSIYENESNDKKHVKQIELDLKEEESDKLRVFLQNINPLEVTPMEALKILDELKRIM